MSVSISAEQRRTVAQYGEASYPNACFGLLLGEKEGREKQVAEIELINSAAEFDETGYFALDAQTLQEKGTDAESKGLEIVGFFCSHPDRPARPSVAACGRALSSHIYLLVGVRQGRAHELTCWKLSRDGKAFLQVEICGA
jgi:proteasome lid subunit RPN8/RPN11